MVCCDVATDVVKLIPLYKKSCVYEAMEDFIDEFRNDPLYSNMSYPIASLILADNAGEWALNNTRWQKLCKDKGFRMDYSCPDRKESSARAERAVGKVEIVIKSILMETGLGPAWWQAAAADCEFLMNRYPRVSMDVSVPLDGDRARPLELLTRGAISRRMIDKQLSYYVGVGTPCLVHDTHAKGLILSMPII